MTNLQKLCEQALRDLNADGLVDVETECGCILADFAPCGDGPYSECQPAIKLTIPTNGELIDPQDGKRVFWTDCIPGDYVMVPLQNWEKS